MENVFLDPDAVNACVTAIRDLAALVPPGLVLKALGLVAAHRWPRCHWAFTLAEVTAEILERR